MVWMGPESSRTSDGIGKPGGGGGGAIGAVILRAEVRFVVYDCGTDSASLLRPLATEYSVLLTLLGRLA